VIEEFPIAFAKGGEVGTAMAVRKVHEEPAATAGKFLFMLPLGRMAQG